MVDIDRLKKLRLETGVSFADCKKALEESGGDLTRAKEILKEKGQKIAELKSQRQTSQGIIDTYIHPNKKVGVLLDLRCESDFVARSSEFQILAHEIALQIAAMKPMYVNPEDITEEFLSGERKIYQEQLAGSDKPPKIVEQVVEGKIQKYKEEIALLSQPWIKDESKTVKELINDYVAKVGENIKIERFARYEI